jgi:hypothetical protein
MITAIRANKLILFLYSNKRKDEEVRIHIIVDLLKITTWIAKIIIKYIKNRFFFVSRNECKRNTEKKMLRVLKMGSITGIPNSR